MTIRSLRLTLGLLSGTFLTSCQPTKDFFGLSQETPDASQVVEHAPLDIPPDFTVRPPLPGAPRPQELQAREEVQQHILSEVQAPPIPLSPPASTTATDVFLDQAKAHDHDPHIRHVIAQENWNDKPEEKSLMEQLAGRPKSHEPVIDPEMELEKHNG